MASMKVAQGILNLSATYRLWQAPFAAAKLAPFLARNDLQRARRVLDVGCGPGTNAHLFAHADYLGVDITPDYIAYARKKFRRPFVVADVSTYELRRTSASTSSCSTGSFTISRPRLCGASWRTCAHFSRPIKLFMRCGGMTDHERGWTQWGDMIRYSPAPFHRRRLILRLADEVPFESVIDVGCGNGELRAALSQHRPLRRLIGVDTAASIIDQNRRVFPGFEFHNMDIASACLPTKCDLVVCSEVIEHVVEWSRRWCICGECARGISS